MNILTLSFIIFLIPLSIFSIENGEIDPDLKEMVELQMARDDTLIPMAKGGIFLPYLVDSQREPMYSIYDSEGKLILDAKPGKRVSLNPGKYTIYVGSGAKENRLEIEVTVYEDRITPINPIWSALIVDVTDPFNTSLRKGYQIILESEKMILGSGIGYDESKGEKPEVWILKPDLYRLSKKGEATDSLRNFFTVRTLPGKVAYSKFVFDEDQDIIVGGGEIFDVSGLKKGDAWSFSALFSGIFSYSLSENVGGKEDLITYNFGTEFKFKLVYDDSDYLFTNKLDIYESFQAINDEDFVSTRDSVKLNSVFMYRMGKYFGPYISFQVKTKIFEEYVEDTDGITVVELDGDERVLDGSKKFLSVGRFTTTALQESIGLNFEFKYGSFISLFARGGWGFKQDLAPRLYVFNESQTTLSRVKFLTQEQGPEFSVYLSLSPFSYLDITQDFLALIPSDNNSEVYYISETTISFRLSSYASIQYHLWIEKNTVISDNLQKSQALTVQLHYNLF